MDKKAQILSKISYLEKNSDLTQKKDYLNELNATLSITVDMIEANLQEVLKPSTNSAGDKEIKVPESEVKEEGLTTTAAEELQTLVNSIKSNISKNFYLRKEKFNLNSKFLLSKLIDEEQLREKKELIDENERQIAAIEENIEDKKLLLIQAEDLFGEFERYFTIIRVKYPQYALFNIRSFIEENCRLIRQKNKKYIRTYLINQAISNKIDEFKEYKIFLRSLDLWKGIVIESNDGNSYHTNSLAITVLQESCVNLLNSISNLEQIVLNLSNSYVCWLNKISNYQIDLYSESKKHSSSFNLNDIEGISPVQCKKSDLMVEENNNKTEEKKKTKVCSNNPNNNNSNNKTTTPCYVNDKENILSSEANSTKFQINSVRSEVIEGGSNHQEAPVNINNQQCVGKIKKPNYNNNNFNDREKEMSSFNDENTGSSQVKVDGNSSNNPKNNKNQSSGSEKDDNQSYCVSIHLEGTTANATEQKMDIVSNSNHDNNNHPINPNPTLNNQVNPESSNLNAVDVDQILTTQEKNDLGVNNENNNSNNIDKKGFEEVVEEDTFKLNTNNYNDNNKNNDKNNDDNYKYNEDTDYVLNTEEKAELAVNSPDDNRKNEILITPDFQPDNNELIDNNNENNDDPEKNIDCDMVLNTQEAEKANVINNETNFETTRCTEYEQRKEKEEDEVNNANVDVDRILNTEEAVEINIKNNNFTSRTNKGEEDTGEGNILIDIDIVLNTQEAENLRDSENKAVIDEDPQNADEADGNEKNDEYLGDVDIVLNTQEAEELHMNDNDNDNENENNTNNNINNEELGEGQEQKKIDLNDNELDNCDVDRVLNTQEAEKQHNNNEDVCNLKNNSNNNAINIKETANKEEDNYSVDVVLNTQEAEKQKFDKTDKNHDDEEKQVNENEKEEDNGEKEIENKEKKDRNNADSLKDNNKITIKQVEILTEKTTKNIKDGENSEDINEKIENYGEDFF